MKFGYYNPSDWKKAGFVDMIVETENEILSAFGKVLLFTADADKPAELEKLKNGALSNLLKICEKQISKDQTKFIAGEELTIADFALSALTFNILKNEMFPMKAALDDIWVEFPNFNAYTLRLKNALKEQLESRPKYPF